MAITERRKILLEAWRARNREKLRAYHEKWRMKNRARLQKQRQLNREKINAAKREFHWKHREKLLAEKKKHYRLNKAVYIKRASVWRHTNIERSRELSKEAKIRNRTKYRAAAKQRYHQVVKKDPLKMLNHRMGRLLYASLRLKGGKQGGAWHKLVGYSSQKLKKHLRSKFTKGMSWAVFLRGEIHVDHIVPISWFKYDSINHPEFKKCWSLKNLQPMWARENMIKQNRWAGRQRIQ